MTDVIEQPTPQAPTDDKSYCLAVYILYLVSYAFGITALVGVIIAHMKQPTTSDILESHFQFQIRTFWIGLIYWIVGFVLAFVLIGIPILLWWFIWSLVRCIKGLILLNDGKPVPEPTSWLFG